MRTVPPDAATKIAAAIGPSRSAAGRCVACRSKKNRTDNPSKIAHCNPIARPPSPPPKYRLIHLEKIIESRSNETLRSRGGCFEKHLLPSSTPAPHQLTKLFAG
jgi:hypothetical protein